VKEREGECPLDLNPGDATDFQGHSHCTKYENNTSALADISASIIQGSAIGPASYVVHASDLVSITACNSLCKYADDTYVIIPASNHLSRCAEPDPDLGQSQ